MSIDIFENVFMLLAAVIGLLLALFKYIEMPKRGWFYISAFFLTHLLSDYYWAIYTLVIGENPDVSAGMAYFGWNVGYLFLLLAVLEMRNPGAKGYFNLLMLAPIPINIWQFALYLPYGGIVNNIWEGVLATTIAFFCIQSFLYYLKNKRNGVHFPWLHTTMFFFIVSEYGMWTSSCFSWESDATNPYYVFSFFESILIIAIVIAASKDYEAEGYVIPDKDADEMRFQILLQIVVTAILFFGCLWGYYIADFMKKLIPEGGDIAGKSNLIAVTLFVISVILDFLILMVIFMTAIRYKRMERKRPEISALRKNRFNFIFTLLITLCLMIFSVAYTARLFRKVSVTAIVENRMTDAASTANELDNYLGTAKSVLWVTADTVELMLKDGRSEDLILKYLTDQTDNQMMQFDENYTGIYAYINGEYLDGYGWVPPEGYVVEDRDWYKAAIDAKGETVIVSPYVDAQTNSIVITICKLLDDGNPGDDDSYDVVALDMVVNHVQEVIEELDLDGKGYGMVVNYDGMIIAHKDSGENGKNFKELFGGSVFDSVLKTPKGMVEAEIGDEDYTLFVNSVMGQWYVVIVVDNKDLYEEINSQLLVSIIVSLSIFLLISFFYYLGYKNELLNSRKMEELREANLKQEYEARALKQKKLAADDANKAKSRFLADMSHEIRTPINAILGMNEMVLRESGNDNVLEYARNIRISGRNLMFLINSILDFSKIEDGKMEIVPSVYSLNSMITYLYNSVYNRAKDKGLELIMDIDQNLPGKLFGDDARINQVIMNLLTNAVKYTPEGSVTLTMRESNIDGDMLLMYVEVRDTGMGIREGDMEKLFESFERLDLDKNRHIEGTGLGMSITTSLLKLMNSELKVESVYGRGSVFSFEIWQRIEDKTPVGDYKISFNVEEEEVYAEAFRAPSARILVVDDTEMNLTVVTNLLKRTQVGIDTATSGIEAIGLVKNNKYDIILMDQLMPGMDGLETLKAIRELRDNINSETPVICLTADAIRGARERLLKEGFSDYLSKPVDGRTLENMILAFLPDYKVERFVSEDEDINDADTKRTKRLFDGLKKAGVDTDEGLSLCVDDEDFYQDILSRYVIEFMERRPKLQGDFEAGDWSSYEENIYAVKNTSLIIGAKELAEVAGNLEEAAGEGNRDVIISDHNRAMGMYDKIVFAISGAR